MKYKVLMRLTAEALSEVVTQHLAEGWQLHGHLAVMVSGVGGDRHYCQAVTLEGA